MVIANQCGHPDCENVRDMLKLAQAGIDELAKELGQALAERDAARAQLAASQASAEDWHRVADGRSAEIIRLIGENERFRAALANSKEPCAYCSLPAEDFTKCKAGFPGCARADDMTGCPEFGAAHENYLLREALSDAGEALELLAKAADSGEEWNYQALDEACDMAILLRARMGEFFKGGRG